MATEETKSDKSEEVSADNAAGVDKDQLQARRPKEVSMIQKHSYTMAVDTNAHIREICNSLNDIKYNSTLPFRAKRELIGKILKHYVELQNEYYKTEAVVTKTAIQMQRTEALAKLQSRFNQVFTENAATATLEAFEGLSVFSQSLTTFIQELENKNLMDFMRKQLTENAEKVWSTIEENLTRMLTNLANQVNENL